MHGVGAGCRGTSGSGARTSKWDMTPQQRGTSASSSMPVRRDTVSGDTVRAGAQGPGPISASTATAGQPLAVTQAKVALSLSPAAPRAVPGMTQR